MLEQLDESTWRVWSGDQLIGEYRDLRSARLAEDVVRQWETKKAQGLEPPPLITRGVQR